MNIERKNIDEVSATITVQIEKNDYWEKVEKNLRNYRQKANIPGFRQGNIPMSLLKKRYGKALQAEEINRLISEKLFGYIRENKIRILGEPLPNQTEQKEIDFDNQDSFEFAFDIGIAPEFDVELSKKESIPYYDVLIDEKMIEEAVKSYTGRFGGYEEAGTVMENDILKGEIEELDAEGKINEEGIKVEKAVLSPEYMKNDAQKALFVGAQKGGIVTFNPQKAFENETEISSLLKISKEKAKELTADFQLTIREITRFKESELNRELFDKAFGAGVVNTEEEFKQKLQEEIKTSLEADSDYKFMMDAREMLVKKLDGLPFPDLFLKRWLLETNEDKKTEEELNDGYPKMIEQLKWHLIKEKIVQKQEIKIEDEDLVAFAKKNAQAQFARYGIKGIPDDALEKYAKEMLEKEDTVKSMMNGVMDEKMLAAIKSSVKLNTKKVSFDHFIKMFENEK